MNKFIKLNKKFFLVSFFLFFFQLLNSLTNHEIEKLAMIKFYDRPGFSHCLNSSNGGKWFELESALCAEKQEEYIQGFSLDINILNRNGEKYFVSSNGKNDFFELKTTEYDVVTENFVFECKSGNPDKIKKRLFVEQFLKEENMLSWFAWIYEELTAQRLKVFLCFGRKGKSIITIKGSPTSGQEVSFTSSWITGKTIEECKEQWFNLIEILAEKQLIIMFKNELPDSLKKKLEDYSLVYKDKISFEEACLEDELFENNLEEELSMHFINLMPVCS